MPPGATRAAGRAFRAVSGAPSCGCDRVVDVVVQRGRVEVVTTLRRAVGRRLTGGVRVALVSLVEGGTAVCRLENAAEGDEVALATEDGAPVARARS